MLPLDDDDSLLRRIPGVTYTLIALNIIFFIFELVISNNPLPFVSLNSAIVGLSFVPYRFLVYFGSDSFTLLTSMFLHSGWLHISGNMLYLWIFGDNVEDRFGHLKFLIFYLACGLTATFSQMIIDVYSTLPIMGASGAIAGVLGAYYYFYPDNKIKVIIGLHTDPWPAWLVIGLWFLLQFLGGMGSIGSATDNGGVAFFAHIGGFLMGLLWAHLFRMLEKHRQKEKIIEKHKHHKHHA